MNTKYGVGSFGVGTVIVSGGDEWGGGGETSSDMFVDGY